MYSRRNPAVFFCLLVDWSAAKALIYYSEAVYKSNELFEGEL